VLQDCEFPSITSKKIMSKPLSELSVFFPCFNEQENVPFFINEALAVLPKVAKKFEIIVLNDGSVDGTKKVAQEFVKSHKNVRLISHKKNRGYGATLKTGFKTAQYKWVFFTDGDLQFSLKEVTLLVEHAEDFEAVIGYRKKRADSDDRVRNASLYKYFVDILFRLHVKDIDCAFKLFKTEVINSMKLEADGAFISAEILYKLKKKKVAFKQVPVSHFPRKFGQPTGANLKVILKACLEILKFYLKLKLGPLFSKSNIS